MSETTIKIIGGIAIILAPFAAVYYITLFTEFFCYVRPHDWACK